jgi:predicted nuclease of predicted toxin-antitoxin system
VKLAIDHHYSPAIAEQLRHRGHDVVAALDRGWEREDDEALLALCAAEDRALLTNNVGDFTVIVRSWALQGRHHAGLVFTADASLPRQRGMIGRYVTALDELLEAHHTDRGLEDGIHWL